MLQTSTPARDKIIAIDFDGCICTECFPKIGEPNWAVINRAKAEQNAGAKLILYTCRRGEELQLAVIAAGQWGLDFDAVNENLPELVKLFGGDTRKIFADEYWDDRAVKMDKDFALDRKDV